MSMKKKTADFDLKMAMALEIKQMVWIPVKSRDKVIGVLGGFASGESPPIGLTEIEALAILANDVSRAIERA